MTITSANSQVLHDNLEITHLCKVQDNTLYRKLLSQVFGVSDKIWTSSEQLREGFGVQHLITKFHDSNTPLDEQERPLDVKLYTTEEGQIYYLPSVDHLILTEAVKIALSKGVKPAEIILNFGYISGRLHHQGLEPVSKMKGFVAEIMDAGYKIWAETAKLSE